MRRTRVLISAAVIALLVYLFAREVRHWSHFDWAVFWRNIRSINPANAIASYALVMTGLLLRAPRWRLLMWPHRPRTAALIPPTLIGFTGLALLGRPGEMVRPYLIARNEGVSVSSQLGVWTLERIFDLGAFAVLVAYAFFAGAGLQTLPYIAQFRRAGVVLLGVVALLAIAALVLHHHGERISSTLERLLTPLSPALAQRVSSLTASFGEGVRSVSNARVLLAAAALSILMWTLIAYSYVLLLHAFPAPLRDFSFPACVVLIGFSIAGGLAQLPGGSTSQLMVIAALVNVFSIPGELAVSCGILLWLCAYMAPVPFGLALLRSKHLSLRTLTQESRAGDAQHASAT